MSERSMRLLEGPFSIASLRAAGWADVPGGPGAYRWYFPTEFLGALGIAEHCDLDRLNLHKTDEGMVGLYFGIASSISQRVKWHAAQRLNLSGLRSGFLSTFRFSLLALTDTEYYTGEDRINAFMDKLKISWVQTNSIDKASRIENDELASVYHYPINIMNNNKPEVAQYIRYLKERRSAYKRYYLAGK